MPTTKCKKSPYCFTVPPVFLKRQKCEVQYKDVAEFRNKLECLKSKIKFIEYIKWKGILNSMLMTKNYCTFDLTDLNNLLIKYECA